MISETKINIFESKEILANKLARDICDYIIQLLKTKDRLFIALSGGRTPSLIFNALVKINSKFDCSKVKIFWVDERCVQPNHKESNFGSANRELLLPLGIPESSYFRIHGENEPYEEAERYGNLIHNLVSPEKKFPVFDLILLGLGTDGHVASIFPHQISKWESKELCTVGLHPESGQQRISFTGRLINEAQKVIFMVTGKEKSIVLKNIITKTGNYKKYPAALVDPFRGELYWYVDKDVAGLLE